jgi:dTDP-4-amino-4,6-dideoxygalactose transaminase
LRNAHLPVTERLHNEVLSLPMGPTLYADAVDRVVEACQAFECPA